MHSKHKKLVSTLSIIRKKYSELKKEKELVRLYVEKCELQTKIQKIEGIIASFTAMKVKCDNDEAILTKLKSIVDKAESISIQNVVHTINTYARQYLDLMFDDPILVELSTTTETQKGKIKYTPSVIIQYQGNQYTSVTQLSGGEQDRVSLAFILAVNEMTRSKILLLDECLASINTQQNNLIIEGLKSFAKKQPVIVVQHNGIEGVFDNVICV